MEQVVYYSCLIAGQNSYGVPRLIVEERFQGQLNNAFCFRCLICSHKHLARLYRYCPRLGIRTGEWEL